MIHATDHPDVKGYLDSSVSDFGGIRKTGWCFHQAFGVLPLRYICWNCSQDHKTQQKVNEGTSVPITCTPRPDVAAFYQMDELTNCQWSVIIPYDHDCVIQMNIGNVDSDSSDKHSDNWVNVFTFSSRVPSNISEVNKKIPTFVVIDDFLKDPDSYRKFALEKQYNLHPTAHKGSRTEESYLFDSFRQRFEEILGAKIKDWNYYPMNGRFQYCKAGDQLVYHTDLQEYAGVFFLSPDAPPCTGTKFFRSKHTRKMKVGHNEYGKVYPTGHLDPTEFEMVDEVGNVYNRLVLFDAQLIHAASCYFGDKLTNSRLFQIFFFDLEK